MKMIIVFNHETTEAGRLGKEYDLFCRDGEKKDNSPHFLRFPNETINPVKRKNHLQTDNKKAKFVLYNR